jgi:short-subunit dehydrogenase
MDFRDKRVWLTGASAGIGEALALELASRGARLLLSARRHRRLEEVRAASDGAERHHLLPFDLANPSAVADAARRVLENFSPLDALVLNAGISQRALAEETLLQVDRRLMEVNFFAPVALAKAVLPSMLERQSGQIVIVSSLVGKFGTPLRSGYSASKHALHGFFDSLRAETWERGIRITLACPGFIRTELPLHALTGDGSPQGRMDRGQLQGSSAEACARRIVRAAERERPEVLVGGKERYAVYLKRFLPSIFDRLIRRARVT